MMVWGINLFILSIGLLIVGMIKPQWILFWMEKPGRTPIVVLSMLIFMVASMMYGEANMEKQKELQNSQSQTDSIPVIEAIEQIKP